MANNLSNAAEVLVLDWISGVGTPTRPTTPLKLALFTSMPNQETGAGGTEVSGGSYARTNVTMTAASAGASSNSADVVFPTASASWGTIVGGAIYNNDGTLMIWSGPLGVNKTIDSGDTFRVPTGSLSISID